MNQALPVHQQFETFLAQTRAVRSRLEILETVIVAVPRERIATTIGEACRPLGEEFAAVAEVANRLSLLLGATQSEEVQ